MHLDTSFMLVKLSPRAKFKTKADGTAVKCINHVIKIKTKVILCIERANLLNKNLSEIGIDSPVSFLISLGKCVTRNSIADTAMIQST